MNESKIREVIQADISSIKSELIENPEVFIKKLVGSLRLIKDKSFSAYKVNLSLSYLKEVYERVLPSVKHGGPRTFKSRKLANSVRNSTQKQVEIISSWPKSVSLVDKAIVINLLKGVGLRKRAPSFAKLVALQSELTSRAIHYRIRVGNYIANCTEANRNILLFRSNEISYTKFLAEIIRKEKIF